MKKTDWKLTSYFAMFCNCAWQNTLHEVNSWQSTFNWIHVYISIGDQLLYLEEPFRYDLASISQGLQLTKKGRISYLPNTDSATSGQRIDIAGYHVSKTRLLIG